MNDFQELAKLFQMASIGAYWSALFLKTTEILLLISLLVGMLTFFADKVSEVSHAR